MASLINTIGHHHHNSYYRGMLQCRIIVSVSNFIRNSLTVMGQEMIFNREIKILTVYTAVTFSPKLVGGFIDCLHTNMRLEGTVFSKTISELNLSSTKLW